MGVYHRFINHDKKAFINPGKMNNGAVKLAGIVYGDASLLFTFMHCMGESNWKIVNDTGPDSDEYYEAKRKYTDVTRIYVALSNIIAET